MTLKKNFQGKITSVLADKNGHFILLTVCLSNQMYLVGNVYGYNNDKENKELLIVLSSHIRSTIKRFGDVKIVLGGDFNVTTNDEIDRFPSRKKENSFLLDFMSVNGLTDA